MSNRRTHADSVFEQYLKSQRLTNFDFDKKWDGVTTKPDYSVYDGDSTYIFEVKEIDPRERVSGFSFGDPYKDVRAKIKKVNSRKQLTPFKGRFPCGLVLWSPDEPHKLIDPYVVGGAMFGNVGLSIPFNPETGESSEEGRKLVYSTGGRMFSPGNREPINTSISAIISLSAFPVGRLWDKLSGHFAANELTAMNLFPTSDTQEIVPGVTVWENGFAAVPFPRDLFNGPFDHRYVTENGQFIFHSMGKAWEVIKRTQSAGSGG